MWTLIYIKKITVSLMISRSTYVHVLLDHKMGVINLPAAWTTKPNVAVILCLFCWPIVGDPTSWSEKVKSQCSPFIMHLDTCTERPLSKRPKVDFQDQLSLNAGQKYCRMLQWEHSAILSTFIKLPFILKILVLSIFEWLFYTDFTV